MEPIRLNTIEEAIADFKEGNFVIVVDDEDRENEGDFIISFGQYLGDIDPYKVYLCAYDNAGTLGWGTTVQYVAPIATDENYNMIFVFADNGTWAKQHVDGFYYGKFTGTPSNSTYKGGYGTATDIVMQTHFTENTD